MRYIPLVITVVALAVGGGACGSPPDDRIPGPELLEDAQFETVETIAMTEGGFDPGEVQLVSGEAVLIENRDDVPHRVRGHRDESLRFDTGDLLPDESTTIRFTTAGVVVFTSESVSGEVSVTVTGPPER